ncbi:MAG: protein-disulfide isomerase [Campylobacteraceae bacterium]|nr:protein-disulfide isomerase [Campylobacteraceae bacterium]
MQNCKDGLCQMPAYDVKSKNNYNQDEKTLFYIGDPMCSWCYGFFGELKTIHEFCTKNGIKFEIVLGGLRVGGGDEWNETFKSFLRDEWLHIGKKTGQKFSFSLFELDEFNYDTGPACLAVFIARKMFAENNDNSLKTLEFFAEIQKAFYEENRDITKPQAYESICQSFDISFDEFCAIFNSARARQELYNDFIKASKLGVRGMPSLMFMKDGKTTQVAAGYSLAEDVIKRVENLL